jgi:hypothetical protein
VKLKLFRFGLQIGDHMPWSESATFRIVSEDGSHQRDFTVSQGEPVGEYRVFTFPEARLEVRYRGEIVEHDLVIPLFDPVELSRVADPADDLHTLPLPEPQEETEAEDEPPDASDLIAIAVARPGALGPPMDVSFADDAIHPDDEPLHLA